MEGKLLYVNITEKEWEGVKNFFDSKGIPITSDTGDFDSHGVKGSYSYVEGNLSVSVTHSPFYLSIAEVTHKLDIQIQTSMVWITP